MARILDIYPLSPMQHGMLVDSQRGGPGVYVQQLTLGFDGELCESVLRQAWQSVVERYSVFRTGFHWDRLEQPVQVVVDAAELEWNGGDLTGIHPDVQRQHLLDYMLEDRLRGFDLHRPPLMRCSFIRLGGKSYWLLWTHHHLLSDGVSWPLVFEHLFDCYKRTVRGAPDSKTSETPYRSFIDWISQKDVRASREFWRAQLQGISSTRWMARRIDALPHGDAETTEYLDLVIGEEDSQQIHEFARSHSLTANTLLQAALALLMQRHTGRDEVVFGATYACRTHELAQVDRIVGLLINTVPVRVNIERGMPVLDWLHHVQRNHVEIQDHAHCSLRDIHKWNGIEGGLLFDTILIVENYAIPDFEQVLPDGLALSSLESNDTSVYPLAICVMPAAMGGTAPGMRIRITYSQKAYSRSEATRKGNQYVEALRWLVTEDTDRTVGEDAGFHSGAAHNDHDLPPWLEGAPLVSRVEQVASATPESIAIEGHNEFVSYSELIERVRVLAERIIALTSPMAHVAVMANRSVDSIVCALAIWKAGRTYVPLNPGDHISRWNACILETRAELVLLPEAATAVSHIKCPILSFPLQDLQPGEMARSPMATEIPSIESMAYTLFTSGSSGPPKGVTLGHAGLANLIRVQLDCFKVQSSSRVLQFAPLTFDASISEIGMSLASGATLCLAYRTDLLPGKQLARVLSTRKVTHVTLPPSALALTPSVSRWPTHVIAAGESCSRELAIRWAAGRKFFNAYGPTETTVCASIQEFALGDQMLSIGRSIPGCEMLILDDQQRPAAPGSIGEIAIGGIGVARGYLNDAQRSAIQFMEHPTQSGRTVFRTGDLGRLLPDGTVEFIGRRDRQVKIRGQRVNLDQIEGAINRLSGVRESAVMVVSGNDGSELIIAFWNGAVEESEIREFIATELSSHMLPDTFVQLQGGIPKSVNGKVDYAALKGGQYSVPAGISGREPSGTDEFSDTEKQIDLIWHDVLLQRSQPETSRKFGAHDDFFEVGGHSLLVARLTSRINEAFDITLPLATVFEHRTISELAAYVQRFRIHPSPNSLGKPAPAFLTDANLGSLRLSASGDARTKSEKKNVLLTGGTGFLGGHIAAQLLEDPAVHVYCLVRATDTARAQQRLLASLQRYRISHRVNSNRVTGLPGDLARENLGLEPSAESWLKSNVDLIIHNGAWVHSVNPYSILKHGNVDGTKAIIRLAAESSATPIVHVSTLGVFPKRFSGSPVSMREGATPDLPYEENGYVQSKWVAEHLMLEAQRQGLPVLVFRPALISGHSKHGVWNTGDLFCRLLRGCVSLGTAPDLGDRPLAFVPVDLCAMTIAHMAACSDSYGRIVNLTNPKPATWNDVIAGLSEIGVPIQLVETRAWLSEIQRSGSLSAESALAPLLPVFAKRNPFLNIEAIHESASFASFLEKRDHVIPSGTQLLHHYLRCFAAEGFFADSMM